VSVAVALLFINIAIPLKFLAIVTILNLLLKENYPFSHYPMYSKFNNESRYIFITDENENPLPIKNIFRINTEFLKKVYMNEVRKIADSKGIEYWLLKPEQLKSAGIFTLDYLLQLNRNEFGLTDVKAIRLYHVFINLIDKNIDKKTYLIAEKIL
jgi:hypothetical protein